MDHPLLLLVGMIVISTLLFALTRSLCRDPELLHEEVDREQQRALTEAVARRMESHDLVAIASGRLGAGALLASRRRRSSEQNDVDETAGVSQETRMSFIKMSVGRNGYAPSQEITSSAPVTLHVAPDPDEVKSRHANANGDPWDSKPPVMTEHIHPQPTSLVSSAGGEGARVPPRPRSARRFLIAGAGLPPGDATLTDGGGAYSDNSCSVCLDEYTEGDQLLQLTCGHVFHRPCIDLWLMEHRVCPCCRTDLDKLAQVAQVFPTTSRRSLQKALNRAEGNAVIAVELLLTRRDRRNVRNASADPAVAATNADGADSGGDGDSLANNVIGGVIDDVIDDVERATEMVIVSLTETDESRGDQAGGRVGAGGGGGGRVGGAGGGVGRGAGVGSVEAGRGVGGGEGGGGGIGGLWGEEERGSGADVIANLGARFRRVDSGLREGRESRSGGGSRSRSRSRSRSISHGASPGRSPRRSRSTSRGGGGGGGGGGGSGGGGGGGGGDGGGGGVGVGGLTTTPRGPGSAHGTALRKGVSGEVTSEDRETAETVNGEIDVEIGGGGIRAGEAGAAAGAAAAATAAAVVAATSEPSASRPSSGEALGGMAGAWAWRRRTASDSTHGDVRSGRDSACPRFGSGSLVPPRLSAPGDAVMSTRSWDEIVADSRTVPPAATSSIATSAAAARVAGAGAGASASASANTAVPPEEGSVEEGTRRSSSLTPAGDARTPRWAGLRFSPPRPSPSPRLESPAFSPRPEVDAGTVARAAAVPVVTLPSVDLVAAPGARIVDEPSAGVGSTLSGAVETFFPGRASERSLERSYSGRASRRSWERASVPSSERVSAEHSSEHPLGRSSERASERASEEIGLVESTATNASARSFAKTPPSGRGLVNWRSYRASVEAAAMVTQHRVAAAGAAQEEEEEEGEREGYASSFRQDSIV